jgi:serine phosphatase RsbU (regulator of sigma subunit)
VGTIVEGLAAADSAFPGGLRLLLVEDDPGDTFLFKELLADELPSVEIEVARSLKEARERLGPETNCAVVDMSLPDAEGLDLLLDVIKLAPQAAVLVLTGRDESAMGIAALAAGAQDYLIKRQVDGPLLARAIRFAVERRRAEESERQLMEAEVRSEENARIERGLLPVPLLRDEGLRHCARYRPGRQRSLLGGDFYDTVQSADGSVHLMIGDVCGSGPDEAALGVRLRMAWRTLILAGHSGAGLLETLDQVLDHERWDEEIFATLCMISIEPSRLRARVHLAGHPPPLIIAVEVLPVPYDACGPALGLFPGGEWPGLDVELGEDWSLLLYTDGLIEGRVGPGPERLETEGLVRLAADAHSGGLAGEALLDRLVSEVEKLNNEPLADDLAILMLSTGEDPA